MKRVLQAMVYFAAITAFTQGQEQRPGSEYEKPLPDIGPMMQRVIANERASEALQPDYLVRAWVSTWDGQGKTWTHGESWRSTKGEERELEVFWLRGVRVSRLVRVARNEGMKHTYDHVLTAEDLHRENARIDAELSGSAKALTVGSVDGAAKDAILLDEIRMSRLLELGEFSNARWGKHNPEGRDTVDIDYKGVQCSQNCSSFDTAVNKMAGVLTIDEEDMTVYEFKGVFAGALLDSRETPRKVLNGREFQYWGHHQTDGVRFPGMMEITTTVGHGSSFTTHSVVLLYREYKKFRVTSKVLPDITLLPDSALQEAPPGAP